MHKFFQPHRRRIKIRNQINKKIKCFYKKLSIISSCIKNIHITRLEIIKNISQPIIPTNLISEIAGIVCWWLLRESNRYIVNLYYFTFLLVFFTLGSFFFFFKPVSTPLLHLQSVNKTNVLFKSLYSIFNSSNLLILLFFL